MKGAFAVAKGDEAVLVDGFGDLGDPDNFANYEKAIESELKKLKVRPKIIACDLHPGYFSSRFAESFQPYRVQHHEAHIASAIVDYAIRGKVIGVAFDGTGYGSDGNVWGGEFFIGGLKNLKRAAHFDYVAMPGADLAVTEPWRMAASYIYRTSGKRKGRIYLKYLKRFKEWPILKKMIDKNINSPLTSSLGRLFDAVGSIVLSKLTARYEAELPIELEKMAVRMCRDRYKFDIKTRNGLIKISVFKTIEGIVWDLQRRVDKGIISAKFHNTVAEVILDTALNLRKSFKINKVILSGGVFQNRFLTARAGQLLKNRKFEVYTHLKVPTNDSGIPIGQIAIANMRARCA